MKVTPDVVYVVRAGQQNEELRYSLRSLQNVPHGTVHISGFIPDFINGNLNRIPVPQHPNKYRSAEMNLLAAIQSDAVSDPFLLFNDDFFMVRKQRSIPTLHRGLLDDVIAVYEAKHSGHYLQGMKHARDLLTDMGFSDLKSYEMHSPLLVHKKQMDAVLAIRGKQDCYHLRTVYGNLAGIGGKQSADVKVYRGTDDSYLQWKMVSTSDMLFNYRRVGAYIRSLFPDRSHYEK